MTAAGFRLCLRSAFVIDVFARLSLMALSSTTRCTRTLHAATGLSCWMRWMQAIYARRGDALTEPRIIYT